MARFFRTFGRWVAIGELRNVPCEDPTGQEQVVAYNRAILEGEGEAVMKGRMGWAVGASMVLAAFGGGFFAQVVLGGRAVHAQGEGQVVRATAFVLVNAEGTELAALRPSADGPQLTMKGPGGHEMAVMGAVRMPHTPEAVSWGMLLRDEEDRDRFVVGRAGDGGGGLACWDEDGTIRVALGGGTLELGCGLTLSDSAGTNRLGAGVGPGVGGANFGISDRFGNEIWRALGDIGPPALP